MAFRRIKNCALDLRIGSVSSWKRIHQAASNSCLPTAGARVPAPVSCGPVMGYHCSVGLEGVAAPRQMVGRDHEGLPPLLVAASEMVGWAPPKTSPQDAHLVLIKRSLDDRLVWLSFSLSPCYRIFFWMNDGGGSRWCNYVAAERQQSLPLDFWNCPLVLQISHVRYFGYK